VASDAGEQKGPDRVHTHTHTHFHIRSYPLLGEPEILTHGRFSHELCLAMEACSDASVATPVPRLKPCRGGPSSENASPQSQSVQATSSAADCRPAAHPRACTESEATNLSPAGGTAGADSEQYHRRLRLSPGDGSAASSNGLALAQLQREGEEASPPAAEATVPAAAGRPGALKERFVRMFLRAEDGPVASGDDPVADEPTLGYVMAVDPVVRDLWRDHAHTESWRGRGCMESGPLGSMQRFLVSAPSPQVVGLHG
jgi:hypothetical protein